MIEALQFDFMRNALAAGILVSVACGIVGTYVVVNRIVFISGGIAHAAYGGIGLGYYLGLNPVWGAVLFSQAAAFGMGAVQRRTRERADTIIGVMWAVGMAIGILLIDVTPGYKADLMSYLFGSILAVPIMDLWLMLGLDVALIVVVAVLYKELVAVSFDETYATISGVRVGAIQQALICLIGLTAVMTMRVVGLILVIALLTIPAAIAGMFVKDMRRMMVAASAMGVLFTVAGLWVSYAANVTSGATIILIAGAAYLIALAVQPSLRRRRGAAREARSAGTGE